MIDRLDTKNKNMVTYLEPEVFVAKYPINGECMAKGTYGKVYTSGSEYVVKQFARDSSYRSLVCELNGYSTNIHPCIMKPLAWTISENIAYMAMPRGIDITKAYEDGKITLEEIISDSLSAIADMNSRGYFHGDIKDVNMVYHDGLCKIIDMGLVRLGILDEDGNFYTREEAYSIVFRDPEYYEGQYNNINTEVYALIVSYLAIIRGGQVSYCDIDNYINGKPHIDWLFRFAKMPLDKRPSTKKLLAEAPKELIVRRYETKTQYMPSILEIENNKSFKLFITTLINTSTIFDISSRDLFLAVNLAYRSYESIIEEDDEELKNVYMIVLLSLVSFSSLSHIKSFDSWGRILKISDLEEKYKELLINVLIALEGIITSFTYWDYCDNPTNFLALLYDMTEEDHDFNLIRSFETKCNLNKDIKTSDIEGINNHPLFSTEIVNKPSRGRFPVKDVYPCKLSKDPSHKAVENMWYNFGKDNSTIYSLLAVLYKNKKELHKVNIKVAVSICQYLHQFQHKLLAIPISLNKTFGSKWAEIIFFATVNKHPFRKVK